MRALGISIIGLGILMIVTGIIGSQHKVLKLLKGVPSAAKGK